MNISPLSHTELVAEVARLRARVAELERALAAPAAVTGPLAPAGNLVKGAHLTPSGTPHAALSSNDMLLQLALDATGLGTWRYDLATGLVTLDERARVHLGLAEQTPSLADFLALVYPEDEGWLAPQSQAALDPAGDGRFHAEHRVIHPDGSVHWLASHALVVFTGDGEDRQPLFALGTTQDITTRKADEAALQAATAQIEASTRAAVEHAARLESLLSHAPFGIALLDREFRYQHINAPLAALNGCSPEAHLGRTIRDVIPALAPELEACYAQVLATGAPLLDVESVYPPGAEPERTRAWQTSYFPVCDTTGALVGVGAAVLDITARRQAEQALQAEHQRLEAILATMDEGVIAARPDGSIVMMNQVARQLVGIEARPTTATVGGTGTGAPAPLLAADGLPLPRSNWPLNQVLRGERFRDLDVRLLGASLSDERWLSVSGVPVLDADGRVGLAILTIRDISARKQAEEALRASESRYRTLFETITHGVMAYDAVGRAVLANPAAGRILGVGPERLLGHTLLHAGWSIIDEDGTPYAEGEHPVQVVLQSGQGLRDVVLGLAPIGGAPYRWLRLQVVPQLRPGETTPAQVYAIFEDITEQRQIQQELEYERQQLAAIVNTMHEGVLAARPDGAIAVINPAGLRLRELDPASPPKTLTELFQRLPQQLCETSEPEAAPVEWPLQRIMRGEVIVNQELCVRSISSGQEHWEIFNGTPVFDERGKLLLGVATARDITQHKCDQAALEAHAETLSKTNAELTRALRLKDEFLAMISHELRTPLNAILGMSEALDEGLYGPMSDRQRQALAKVMRGGRHLLGLLSDILDLAHIEAGKAHLETQPVDVELLCRTATQFVQGAAQQKGLHLQRTIAVGVEGVRGDERRLTQILVNLLDNAVKFTQAGGTVGLEVTADPVQEQIQFIVWDTGIGIAEADHSRLFKPFTQLDGRLARQYEGLGLGLTLVRHLTELHGGGISVVSLPNIGSRFTVSLPWSSEDNVAPLPAQTAAPTPRPWGRPPRLVLADDHELTLELYAELLREQGCEVFVARTGVEAVAQTQTQRPEVVILDTQMPGLECLAAIRQIRVDPAVGATPIIALTVLELPGDRERYLKAGTSAYLVKPVGVRALVATIAEVLAGSQMSSM